MNVGLCLLGVVAALIITMMVAHWLVCGPRDREYEELAEKLPPVVTELFDWSGELVQELSNQP